MGFDHCQSNNHPVCMMMLPCLVLHNIFFSRTKQTKCLLANLANLGENFLPPGALDPSWDVEQDGVSPFWPWRNLRDFFAVARDTQQVGG